MARTWPTTNPFIPQVTVGRETYEAVQLTEAEIGKADLVALLTPHKSLDLGWLMDHALTVFDARNVTRGHAGDVEIL